MNIREPARGIGVVRYLAVTVTTAAAMLVGAVAAAQRAAAALPPCNTTMRLTNSRLAHPPPPEIRPVDTHRYQAREYRWPQCDANDRTGAAFRTRPSLRLQAATSAHLLADQVTPKSPGPTVNEKLISASAASDDQIPK